MFANFGIESYDIIAAGQKVTFTYKDTHFWKSSDVNIREKLKLLIYIADIISVVRKWGSSNVIITLAPRNSMPFGELKLVVDTAWKVLGNTDGYVAGDIGEKSSQPGGIVQATKTAIIETARTAGQAAGAGASGILGKVWPYLLIVVGGAITAVYVYGRATKNPIRYKRVRR